MIGKQMLIKIITFSIIKASCVSAGEISIINNKENTGNYFNPKSLAMILFQCIIRQLFSSPFKKQEKQKNIKREKNYIGNVHALGIKITLCDQCC